MIHPVIDSLDAPHHHDAPDWTTQVEPAVTEPLPREGPAEVKDGTLHFQRCCWCGTPSFRRLLCPACGCTDLAWEPGIGTGVIRRVTVGRNAGVPRPVAVIAMDEGYRLRARIIGAPPERIHQGALVRLATSAGLPPQELVFQLCDVSYAREGV
ncbi:Zn-ribbon domain-containing OB-fold protein [Streptomyces sp. NPDC093589]|uniref:Zn-ribbon domain-containing OB-fold protein n=1 Tax=Streptomyces sp. NPDC093589 TaxID=3366043 RepID=UPI0038191F1D